jgi:hypothetical protein
MERRRGESGVMLRSDTHGSEWSERSQRSEFEQVARMGWAMERSGASSAFRIASASVNVEGSIEEGGGQGGVVYKGQR